jgi:hypothetical protein
MLPTASGNFILQQPWRHQQQQRNRGSSEDNISRHIT